jgi:hypothetical protein
VARRRLVDALRHVPTRAAARPSEIDPAKLEAVGSSPPDKVALVPTRHLHSAMRYASEHDLLTSCLKCDPLGENIEKQPGDA